MKFSTPILAKDLKSELTSFGVKVLMCKQSNQNAILTISSDEKSLDLFLSFCELNNYAGVCGLSFINEVNRSKKSNRNYLDLGNIFKFIEVC